MTTQLLRHFPSLSLALFSCLLLACSCQNKSAHLTPAKEDIALQDGRILVRADSKLLRHLQVLPVQKLSAEKTGFKIVGQILALANPSVEPLQKGVSWVELDPQLSQLVGLDLSKFRARPGDAFGLTQIPRVYAQKVHPGQKILAGRYGLQESYAEGTVTWVQFSLKWGEDVPVVFRIEGEQGWLPGANCEVVFPFLQSQKVRIPTTALLHEGIHEYVLKEAAPGQFIPKVVTIGEGNPEEVDIVAGLDPDDQIVARGAILLKPYLHQLLTHSR